MKTERSPEWLDPMAKKFWRKFVDALAEELTPQTQALVETMAQHYSVYRQAEADLRKEGRVISTESGTRKVHPLLQVENQAWNCFIRGFRLLGLSDKKAAEVKSELDSFLETNE